MNQTHQKIALIPAYQPDETLVSFVQTLGTEYHILVIDDGSRPECKAVFDAVKDRAIVLIHPQNRGKGAAIKTALAYIRDNFKPPYVVVTLDADGQHRLADAAAVCQKAADMPGSLVLGCRSFTGDVPARSRFGNAMTRLVFRLSSGQAVSDTQTGLRAFTDELTDRLLKISGERYEYEMNMLMICAREHVPMHEVKIETIYINDNASSHFSPIKDSLRIYGEILKFSASSLSCFALDYVLYCLLIALSGSEVLANVAARLVSSFVNFTFNRMFVFHDKGHIAKAAVQYFALAALILGGNTVLLYILVDLLGMNSYVAKLITELCLFLISWTVQHCVIFRKKTSRPV